VVFSYLLLSEQKAKRPCIPPGVFGDQHFDVLYGGHVFNVSMSYDGSTWKVTTADATTAASSL
jgi:hypothetical protein